MNYSPFYTEEQLRTFSSREFRYVKVRKDGHILILTLARPDKRNAFTPGMAAEIAYALGYANWDEAIRVVVIRAEGPVFCAGADLNAFLHPEDSEPGHVPEPTATINLGEAFAGLYKPSIAQIEGSVMAGGFLILAGVTFAYSVPQAEFALPEVKRGLWPMQVMASLSTIIPPRKILEMCITGRTYTAAEACEMGLVTTVIPRERIAEEVMQMAIAIARNAPLAISRGLRAFRHITSETAIQHYRYLQEELNMLLQSEDAREGIAAFKEKREPVWKNR